jgi:hypothetical protein
VAVRKTHKLYTFFSRFSFALVCVWPDVVIATNQ